MPDLSGLEWAADDLIRNRHVNFRLALYAINSLAAELRDAGASHNVNNLLLIAQRA
jgi:hypothetical protein